MPAVSWGSRTAKDGDHLQLERHMDCSVLECTRGGKTGGTSTETEAGRALMETYGAFCRRRRSISPSSFPNIFKKRKRRFPAASPAGKASFFVRFGFRKAESFPAGERNSGPIGSSPLGIDAGMQKRGANRGDALFSGQQSGRPAASGNVAWDSGGKMPWRDLYLAERIERKTI